MISISLKRILYVGILVLGLLGGLLYCNPKIKCSAVYIYFKGLNYTHCFFNKAVFGRPHPICCVNDQHVLEVVKNPPLWVTQQITNDFRPYTKFSAADTRSSFDVLSEANMVIKVTLKDNQVLFTKKEGTTLNEACEFGLELYKAIFQYALKQRYVQNVEFLLKLSDVFPEVPSGLSIADFTPILGVTKDSSKPMEKEVILIPDWMNLNSWAKLKSRLALARETYPWDKKTKKIIWRGGFADVTGYRKKVVDFVKATGSEFVDAKFTEGYDENFMLPEQQLQYQYQLTIDGHTAAWERPLWQLYSNSVMIKQKSPRIQWYYNAIHPGQHYIEVTDNPQDLRPAMSKYTDQELQKMSQNAHEFVKNNLSTDDMVAYIILVLQKIEKLQKNKR